MGAGFDVCADGCTPNARSLCCVSHGDIGGLCCLAVVAEGKAITAGSGGVVSAGKGIVSRRRGLFADGGSIGACHGASVALDAFLCMERYGAT